VFSYYYSTIIINIIIIIIRRLYVTYWIQFTCCDTFQWCITATSYVYCNINKNLAIANTSRISGAHNTSRAFKPNYPVTLKSRLRVTQGHWKWNHSIDHTW